MRAAPAVIALIFGAAAVPARAGAARCWFDNGAVVVSASLGDIAGDFILDLATPHSLLHLTRARSEGLEGPHVRGPLRLAGRRLGEADFQITDLDARNRGFPTELSGVIGADVLAGSVIDLTLTPACRIAVRGRRAPRFGRALRLPLEWRDGAPTVMARVSDGRTLRKGRFALETGGAGVRLSPAVAALSRTPPGIDAASRTQPPARLRSLKFGGTEFRDLPSALDPDAPPSRLGDLGATVWSRYAARIDLRRNVLEVKPASLSWGGTDRAAVRVGKSEKAR